MESGTLSLRLVGEVAVARNGAQVTLPGSKKTRALLAYLAATGQAHRREKLCSMFWEIPDDPKGALRWSLSKIRQAVDEENGARLDADREHVRLDLSGVELDLARLQAAAEGGDLAALEAAAEISGEFAPGVDLKSCEEFGVWLAAVREDVRQRQLSVLRQLVDRLEGEPDRALRYARMLVEVDPLDENARARLVGLLARSDRSKEAAQQRALAIRALDDAGIPVPDALLKAAPRPKNKPPEARPVSARQQRVEFCNAADGTGLAYSCVGEGPPLVKTANWLNHLEFEWESPIWRHWIEELSRDHMLLRYDERGNGLSDWNVENLSFEALVQDLETVVDAARVDRFDLLGISQGCAVSIAYAVRHPERVKRMILYGGFARGWKARGDPGEIAQREAMQTLTSAGWGKDNPAFRQMFTTLYLPGATAEQARWFNELQRMSASPEGAKRLQRTIGAIDVTDLLPRVSVPTLVVHCRDDEAVPFGAGRSMAQGIPGARFVVLESPNHLVLEDEPAWPRLVACIREFLDSPENAGSTAA